MSSSEGGRKGRPRLVRSRRGRLIGGVCSGLGTHFDVDPILFRIAFVGLAIFSGIGIGLYLAILLLVPEEGASRAPIYLCRSSWRSVLGVVVVIVAAGIALDAAGHAGHRGAWGFGIGVGSLALVGSIAALLWLRLRRPIDEPGHQSGDRRLFGALALGTAVVVWAVLLAVAGAWLAGIDEQLAAWTVVAIGVALVLCAFTHTARWLVPPAVAFALAVAVIAAAHVDLRGGVGERTYRPHTLSEMRGGYRLGAGRLEIDLRGIAFPPGTTPLHVRLGVGELVVVVPHGVCVATSARIGGGYVGALERGSGGLDVNWAERPSPPPHTPRLVLDGNVGLGALLVADHPVERAWNGWGSWGGGFGGHFHPDALGTNEACLPSVGAS
ncbi:MAG TPA: PspC domain-containing protein [Solirubrobacteraceae bacterium]|jgi:phage shock protein PspC (stress-responsive transcriptional regulator)|nr:PspC domain-containing protein [Solirubrobacteraceae bacterium]